MDIYARNALLRSPSLALPAAEGNRAETAAALSVRIPSKQREQESSKFITKTKKKKKIQPTLLEFIFYFEQTEEVRDKM